MYEKVMRGRPRAKRSTWSGEMKGDIGEIQGRYREATREEEHLVRGGVGVGGRATPG